MLQCIGCKKQLKSDKSYRNHQRSCKMHAIEAAQRLHLKRKTITEKADALAKFQANAAEECKLQHATSLHHGVNHEPSVLEIPMDVDNVIPEVRSSGRPNRCIKLPERYRDAAPLPKPRSRRRPVSYQDGLPAEPPSLMAFATIPALTPIEDSQTHTPTHDNHDTKVTFRSLPNKFGVFRVYPGGPPPYTPDELYTISDSVGSSNLAIESLPVSSRLWFTPHRSEFAIELEDSACNVAPFANKSVFHLMSWYYDSSTIKSHAELDRLVNDVILAPDFFPGDLIGFRAAKEAKRMDDYRRPIHTNGSHHPTTFHDEWIETSVCLSLPCDGVTHASEARAPKYEVKGLYYRRLLEVIKAGLAEPAAAKFHLFPFMEYWKPSSDEPEERIYSEVYTADYFLEQFQKLHPESQTNPGGRQRIPVIIGIMIYSDSTLLANFGTASLWPIYLYFGNQSKYSRAKPSDFAAHHLAYIPKLGHDIQEEYKKHFEKLATSEMLTHLRRELIQAVWLILMDEDFMHAYIHGIELSFVEDDPYLYFPRFLTDSKDYPEKILMACLKYLANCPCPRCLILKSRVPRLGTKADARDRQKLARIDSEQIHNKINRARQRLFVDGKSINSVFVNQELQPTSLVPTRNAFSIRLFEHGFNFYQMLVPDLMHEFELGVWKSVFTHLMRILFAQGSDTISELNFRYRNVPPFGRATIRKFHNNASAMKRLAARDFEDLLQCAIPVFEGLLPSEHDCIVHTLLFELATWHALAKLRLHTETTVMDLENSTVRLGECMRRFAKDVCPQYDTRELPSELVARSRRKASQKAKTAGSTRSSSTLRAAPGPQQKLFNMQTYKYHALGDYAAAIRQYGTVDGYNSQIGELEHRRPKRHYPHVRKGKHVSGIAKVILRERLAHVIKQQQSSSNPEPMEVPKSNRKGRKSAKETLPPTDPAVHHHISMETRNKLDIADFLDTNEGDAALENFVPQLIDHLLARVLEIDRIGVEHEFTDEERATLIIENHRLYQHCVLRVNYTTYDNRRDQDTINPRTRPDIMMLSGENNDDKHAHPYWYARVLGIFHARVLHVGPQSKSSQPQRMEFLFVRWFGHHVKHRAGWKARHLYKVSFLDGNSNAFGFVDPAHIIRAVHLIPAFFAGKTSDLLPFPSQIARRESDGDQDWHYYYVAMFADRDTCMRYRGGGVGHLTTRAATDFFKTDRHSLDHHIQQPQATDDVEDPVFGGEDSAGSDEEYVGSDEESGQEEGENEEEKGDENSDSEDGEIDEIEQLGFAQL